MPRYQEAVTYDIVRVIKNLQLSVRELQVNAPSIVKPNLNKVQASLNTNPYFWGGDITGWSPSRGTLVVVSDPPAGAPYPYAGMYINDGTGAGSAEQPNASFPVIPGQQYQVTAWVNSSAASIISGLAFQDVPGHYMGISANTTFAVTPNTWTQLTALATAPAGAAYGYVRTGSSSGDFSTTFVQALTVVPISVPGAWQDMRPLSNSFIGTNAGFYPPQYRLDGRGYVEVAGWIKSPPTTGNYNSVTFFTMPAGFRPSIGPHSWLITDVNIAATPQAPSKVSVSTAGSMFLNFLPASLAQTTMAIAGRYPLDSSGLILT